MRSVFRLERLPAASLAPERPANAARHRNNFNLLRFVFASLVIVSHYPELRDGDRRHEALTRVFGTLSLGELAVDSFFLVSGFLIVKSWQSRPDVAAFLRSRVLRIYPGFIAAALLCALVVGPRHGSPTYFQDLDWKQFLLGLPALCLQGIPPVFAGTPNATLDTPMWTIPYEFKCYLLVLACGIAALLRGRIWLALFVAGATGCIADDAGLVHLPYHVYFYARFLMAFAAGGWFQLHVDQIPWRPGLAWAALLLACAFLFFKPIAEPALCVFWGYALFYYAMSGRALLAFNRFPDVSYGVYLYAWPINKMILWRYPNLDAVTGTAAVFVLAVLAGAASWYIVEKPFMELKAVVRPRRVAVRSES